MKTSSTTTPDGAPHAGYTHRVDADTLDPRFNALVAEITAALSTEVLTGAFDAGVDSLASILRAIPIHEGRLLERGIGLIAETNPDLVVLTDNLRLPVTAAAMQLVEKNASHLYRTLTLDADAGGRKSYTPDMLLLNRRTKIAHVVDVKRSLSSYEASRIAELKNRMLASALIVPDLLYREHRRLVAEEVRVVIVNAESQRSDIDGGIWPLGHLDHLLEISGAGEAMIRLRQLFRERIEANWAAARVCVTARVNDEPVSDETVTGVSMEHLSEGTAPNGMPAANDTDGRGHSLPVPRIGFARVPARTG
ncbi:hypothetical protein [Rhizobium sp. 9140]|uniref:hypothetical protein n=1 Tax=Rhizobium sp. 9140 TaxID=1761900 RepID=UPI000792D3EB|nr:hypothetical protein [Rhizobium sp. 9140]CZT38069.1 hypothetical protein GA0004734_00049440 [Rhizobium sp. 9140]